MVDDQTHFDLQMEAARRCMDQYAGALSKLGEIERLEKGTQMNITVRKIGNSEGVILPKEMLEHLNVHAGDTLAVVQEQGELRLRRLEDDPEEFERKMKVARERMRKYETAYRALAK
ncbi:hypothetical protein GCM10016234_03460 [Tianweitania populi]|uniref:SpoVT-AbrB domain-containing protein n=2 Tax=Phyllobacteriaceae TaxID=69277 RepID=A0A8J3DMR9_9HYPH|nr:hypothetical protein GCM10016234_03460 [Tianweitania populi]